MAIPSSCPGSKNIKQPVPEYKHCPKCKDEVEIWSDDLIVECPQCRCIISKEMKNSCIEWCKFAKECVGEEIIKKLREEKIVR